LQAAPAARILMLLRDPVERYASALAHRAKGGAPVPHPEGAVVREIALGIYSRQVQRVLAAYPVDQVLILQYERCGSDYEHELDRTYEFLGLSPGFRPAEGAWGPRSATTSSAHLEPGLAEVLAEVYAADAAQLAALTPQVDPALWPSVAARL
jgi:hypothetical protein